MTGERCVDQLVQMLSGSCAPQDIHALIFLTVSLRSVTASLTSVTVSLGSVTVSLMPALTESSFESIASILAQSCVI